jgi:hypothetical protein
VSVPAVMFLLLAEELSLQVSNSFTYRPELPEYICKLPIKLFAGELCVWFPGEVKAILYGKCEDSINYLGSNGDSMIGVAVEGDWSGWPTRG